MTAGRTAFVFPGLNGAGHRNEHEALQSLPGFDERWQHVCTVLAEQPGFAAFDRALRTGADLPLTARSWPWRALAVTAMQLAAAETLEQRGEHADWLCGYSVGDVARSCYAGATTFSDAVAFARSLPRMPVAPGRTAALHSPNAVVATELERRLTGFAVAISHLSPRFLMIAGAAEAVHDALDACRAPGVRMQVLATCPMHAPIQQPLSRLLTKALAGTQLQPPRRRMFSTRWDRAIDDRDDLRIEFATNVATTVDFASTVRRLHEEHGVTRFVDLGPGRHAQRFVRHHGSAVQAVSAAQLLLNATPV